MKPLDGFDLDNEGEPCRRQYLDLVVDNIVVKSTSTATSLRHDMLLRVSSMRMAS
jgi:hypothetical protein